MNNNLKKTHTQYVFTGLFYGLVRHYFDLARYRLRPH